MRSKMFFVFAAIDAALFTGSSLPARAQEVVVSPLVAGANAEYDMAGFYYGTLPASDNASRRGEFIKLLKDRGIRALRFPGGTPAITQFLVDNDAMMQKVTGARGFPEGDPKKYVNLWQFLDFCKEAGITPVYQVNTLLYCDGSKVYQIAGSEGRFKPPIVRAPAKRAAAAAALTELVKKVRDRGYNLKHWEFGNEEYAYFEAKDYADLAIQYARAIRAADPEAMLWITLGSNHCSESDRKTIPPWGHTTLKEYKKAGLTKDRNLGFTLHYVWPEYIELYTDMVKHYGFRPRFAVTEFHMAGAGPYWDLSPRFGYALGLADYLISMVQYPSVEMLCIHELTSQNFGILHYNQRSYEAPWLPNWDPKIGYVSMPSAYVYGLFDSLIGGRIIGGKATDSSRLVVELGKERRIFFVNATVNPRTVRWKRAIVGKTTKSFECRTIVPNLKPEPVKNAGGVSAQALGQSNQSVDPLRVDRVEEQTQSGKIADDGMNITFPSYSINYVRCFE